MKKLNKTSLAVLCALVLFGILLWVSSDTHGKFYEKKVTAVNFVKSRIDSPSSFTLTDTLGNKITVDEIGDPLTVSGDTLFDTIYHVMTPYGECGLSTWPSSVYTIEEVLDYVGIYKLDGIDKIYVIGLYWPRHSVIRINYEAENEFGAKKAHSDDIVLMGDSAMTVDEFADKFLTTDTINVIDIGGPLKYSDEVEWVVSQHKED